MLVGQLAGGAQASVGVLFGSIVGTGRHGGHVMGDAGLGAITLQLGVEVLDARLAKGSQGHPCLPPQLRIDDQIRDVAVEKSADLISRLGVGCRQSQGVAGPDALQVAAGLGLVKSLPCSSGLDSTRAVASGIRQVVLDRHPQLLQHCGEDGRFSLLGAVQGDSVEVVLNLELGVANRIPQHRPDQRAGQRVRQAGQVGQHRFRPGGPQTHLGVGEVVVVDEDEIRGRLADGLAHRSTRRGQGHIDEVSAHQIVSLQRVQADAQGVRTTDVSAGTHVDGVTHHGELLDDPVTNGEFRQQDVRSGGLEPGIHPGAQVSTACLLEVTDEIVESG